MKTAYTSENHPVVVAIDLEIAEFLRRIRDKKITSNAFLIGLRLLLAAAMMNGNRVARKMESGEDFSERFLVMAKAAADKAVKELAKVDA